MFAYLIACNVSSGWRGKKTVKMDHISKTLMSCCFGKEMFRGMVHYLSKLTISAFLKCNPRTLVESQACLCWLGTIGLSIMFY